MVKLTCPRSMSRGVWHSLGIEPRSWNLHPTSSTISPRTHKGNSVIFLHWKDIREWNILKIKKILKHEEKQGEKRK